MNQSLEERRGKFIDDQRKFSINAVVLFVFAVLYNAAKGEKQYIGVLYSVNFFFFFSLNELGSSPH